VDIVWLHSLAVFGLSYVLGVSASFLAKRAEIISKKFGISDFVIGFFIIGVATSMPEITVAATSAWKGIPELSLGNLMGASIVIFSLLIGLATFFAGKLKISHFLKDDDFILYCLVSVLPALAVIDGSLTRLDGAWLIGAYLILGIKLYRRSHVYNKHMEISKPKKHHHLASQFIAMIFGVAMVIVTSTYLVNSAVALASILGVPAIVIGLLGLSIGTNLPELALVLTSGKNKDANLVMGDLMSNVLLNVPTLGLLALIHPFQINQVESIIASAVFLAVSTGVFGFLMWSKRALTRKEGFLLIFIYIVYAWISVRLGSI
jgi:cation:H+ antiporter